MANIPKKNRFSCLILSGPVSQTEAGSIGFILTILIIVPLLMIQCSDNDEQRQFERQAFQSPSEITETNEVGELTGNQDPDDWRIAPFFQGRVLEVHPAYPNPASTTQDIYIDITLFTEAVSSIRVFVIHEGTGPPVFLDEDRNPGMTVILRFQAIELLRFEGETGIRRILLLDGNDNIISYGDILVE